MVERELCSFCGAELEPGTGKMFVKRDGTVLTFDSNKCFVNMVKLGRVPRKTMWTRSAVKEKATRMGKTASAEGAAKSSAAPEEKAETGRKAKKVKATPEPKAEKAVKAKAKTEPKPEKKE